VSQLSLGSASWRTTSELLPQMRVSESGFKNQWAISESGRQKYTHFYSLCANTLTFLLHLQYFCT